MAAQRTWMLLALLVLSGCYSLPDSTDAVVNSLAREVRDPLLNTVDATPLPPAALAPGQTPAAPRADPGKGGAVPPGEDAYLKQLAAAWAQKQETKPPLPPVQKLLTIPEELPGLKVPPLDWPTKDRKAQQEAIKRLFPPLPALPPEQPPQLGPDGRPLTLSDLQSLATANNPTIKNAVAGIEAAKGALKQAGAYPNPFVAWEADTIGTSGGKGSGYQGAWVDQIIKGGNDLKLKTAAALMDLDNARLALKKARYDLATQVRSYYFAVLVARENIKVSRALARFTDEVFRVQVDLLRAGTAAPYEPMQVRALALQARFNLYQAHNQYLASWRQLAAALGLPHMPPTDLAGRVDLPVPVYDYQAVLDQVLNRHTDVLTGMNNIQKGRYLLELARVAPFPDFDTRLLIQKDYTAPPFLMVYSAVLSFQLPVWDLNRGNLLQARGQLTQFYQAPQMTRLQLTGTLADAFNRYVNAREQVRIAMLQIQDQVRVYRGVYERYRRVFPGAELFGAGVTFGDVVTAQQTLATYIISYITALGAQWTAVVDVANLLQTDDLFQTGRTQEVLPVPDLEHFLPWPCVRPELAAGKRAPAADKGKDAAVRSAALLPPQGAGVAPARLGPAQPVAEAGPVIQAAPESPPVQPVAAPARLAPPR
jgi:cobalt-zinc-cadmium efflux system outer membrane protein